MIKLAGPLSLGNETPVLNRLLALMNSLPKDEVYTTEEILSKSGVGMTLLQKHKGKLTAYRQLAGKRAYYGHPKAIEEFKRRLANL